MLGSMFIARDLGNSTWKSLEPPKLKLDTVKEMEFAGGEDTIFLIVRKRFGFMEDSDEFVVSASHP